jgi:hypothetical protein
VIKILLKTHLLKFIVGPNSFTNAVIKTKRHSSQKASAATIQFQQQLELKLLRWMTKKERPQEKHTRITIMMAFLLHISLLDISANAAAATQPQQQQ